MSDRCPLAFGDLLNLLHDCFSVYPCPVGQFSESGNDPCVDCEIGYYSDTSGSTVCIECPEGSTTAHRGSSMPEACVASDSSKEPKTNNVAVRPAKTSISLGIRQV